MHPKRYFVIDFQTAILYIRNDKKSAKPDDKQILFRDILDCYLPKQDLNSEMPKGWENPLYLQTRSRLFVLCAKSLEDRNMWMAGFRYILASTLTVQTIMKNNHERMEHKMKVRTQMMVREGSKVEKRKKLSTDLERQNTDANEDGEDDGNYNAYLQEDNQAEEINDPSRYNRRRREAVKQPQPRVQSQLNDYELKQREEKRLRSSQQKEDIKEQLKKLQEEKNKLQRQRMESVDKLPSNSGGRSGLGASLVALGHLDVF